MPTMSKERQHGEPRNPLLRGIAAVRERHRAGVAAAQKAENEDPTDTVDLSRRRLLIAGGFGAGATATGLFERHVLGLESSEDERRAHFTQFVNSVNSVTNFEAFYPGGFAGVTDEDLKGLFVVRAFSRENHVRVRSQLSLPSEPSSPYNGNLGPAIEVANIRNHTGTPQENSILRITGHFVTSKTDNGVDFNLFNLDAMNLPKHSDLSDEDARIFAQEVITDPLLVIGAWDSWIDPSERDEHNQAWKNELSSTVDGVTRGLIIENTGETIYTRIQSGSGKNV